MPKKILDAQKNQSQSKKKEIHDAGKNCMMQRIIWDGKYTETVLQSIK